MKFKLWLEALNRDSVKKIVLDAVGGSRLPHEQQSQLLGSLVVVHPDLIKKLGNYSEIKPIMGNIQSFVQQKQNADLISLINYISGLNKPSAPKPDLDDAHGDVDQGDYDNNLNSGISPI